MVKWECFSQGESGLEFSVTTWRGATVDGSQVRCYVCCGAGDGWEWDVRLGGDELVHSPREYKRRQTAQAACERWLRKVGLLTEEG